MKFITMIILTLLITTGCTSIQETVKNAPEFQAGFITDENTKFYELALLLDNEQVKKVNNAVMNESDRIKTLFNTYSNHTNPIFDEALAIRVSNSWEKTSANIIEILNEEQKKIFNKIDGIHRNFSQRTSLLYVKLLLTESQVEKIDSLYKKMPDSQNFSENNSQIKKPPENFQKPSDEMDKPSPGGRNGFPGDNMPGEENTVDQAIESILTSNQLYIYNELIKARGEVVENNTQRPNHGKRPGSGSMPSGGRGMPGGL